MIAAVALAAAAALLIQKPEPRHVRVEVNEIKFAGQRDRHRIADLDGDGFCDLIIINNLPIPVSAYFPRGWPLLPFNIAPAVQRRIEIFWGAAGGFSQKARTTYGVPRGARMFCVADALPAPGKEIIIFDKSGLRAVNPNAKEFDVKNPSEFRRVARVEAFFDFAGEEDLPDWSLYIPGTSPGTDLLIAPAPDGFRVIRPSQGGGLPLAPAEALRLVPTATIESSANRYFAVTKTLPRPSIGDVDGDGAKDFFMLDPTGAPQMIVYLGRPGGRFAREPVVRASPTLRRELQSDQLTYEAAEAADLDRDGVEDMMISHTEGNIGLWDTLTTSQLIYYGRKSSSGYDPRPDQVVSSAGVSILPRAIDFDGDGFLDLLVSSYRTDLLSNVKNAVFNSARVSYFLFLMENGKYPRDPTVERHVDLDFKVLERGGIAPRAYFDGDFDGDGVKDLLAVEELLKVRAYKGTRRKATFIDRGGYDFDSDPMMEIELRAPVDLEITDVDGDKRSEIVFPDSRAMRIVKYKP